MPCPKNNRGIETGGGVYNMTQVEDRLYNVETVLSELGSSVFQMEDGQVVTVLDEEYKLALPPSYLTK